MRLSRETEKEFIEGREISDKKEIKRWGGAASEQEKRNRTLAPPEPAAQCRGVIRKDIRG